MLKNITEEILLKLGIQGSSIAIPKYGIIYYSLVYALINNSNIDDAAQELGISSYSLQYNLRRPLKNKLIEKSRNSSWNLALLKYVGYIECTSCMVIKEVFEFSDKFISKCNYICKECNNTRAKENRRSNPIAVQEYNKKYYEEHKAYFNAKSKFRRIGLTNRTPSWAEKEKIFDFYKHCPEGFHVDHIIPLNGDIVSGLHVLSNLQYLTATENLSKGNSYNGI